MSDVRGNPEDIDAPWLTEALGAAGIARGARVVEVRFGGYIGTGQAARSARFHLEWSDPEGRPATLVGKFPSDDEATRSMVFATGGYLKEWVFYDRMVHTVDVRAPACHVARFDHSTPDFVLLMEDIAEARQGDQIEGLTVDQVALAVEQAAGLHAPRFGDASLPQVVFEGQPVSSNAEAGGFCQTIYESVLPEFLERFGDRLDDDVRDLVEELGEHVGRWFQGTDSPETLIHMDLRADNLLFGDGSDAPPIVVVDYQSLSVGPGGNDLAYVVAGSFADRAQRAGVERDLVEDYRARMAAAGAGQSADELWRDYRHGSLWGVIMTVMASISVEATERGDDMFVAMVERHAHQAIDLEALAVVK